MVGDGRADVMTESVQRAAGQSAVLSQRLAHILRNIRIVVR
jgi:hypothetical protein